MAEDFSVLGKRLPRKDAVAKVKGEVVYIPDIQLPRMLHARFLRSPYPHARIKNIDTSQAEALEGVRIVLTYKNVPKVHPPGKFEYLLDEEVHYVGEEVAAVAAETEEIVEEALGLIKVDYDTMPGVYDILEAMKPGAPLVHPEYKTNLFHGLPTQPTPRAEPDGWVKIEYGDIYKGFAEADAIVENSYKTRLQHHVSPLTRSCVCVWNGDVLTCWTDTQIAMTVHKEMAAALGMPLANVRIICGNCVGCYGGKEPEKIGPLTAIMAKRTDRPVRVLFTRAEDFVATRLRPYYHADLKVGVKKDGTISAMQSRLVTSFGRDNKYGLQDPTCAALNTCTLLYNYNNSKVEVCTVMANFADCIGMNSFGDTPAGFCVERLMDEAAEKINMDPVEFRLKNCMRYGSKGQRFVNILGTSEKGSMGTDSAAESAKLIKAVPTTIDWGVMGPDIDSFPECIRLIAEKSDWKNKWQGWRTPVAVNGTKRRGIGIGIGTHHTVYYKYAAIVKMNHDGTANVLSGGAEIGQGFGTAIAQVAAETLGVRYEDINVVLSDSAVTPAGFGNIGSGGVSSGAAAVWHASLDARQKLFAVAAEQLKVKPEELELKNRRIYVKNRPEIGMSIADACVNGYQITGVGVNPAQETIVDKKSGKVIYPFAVAATISEVEVDTETGEVTLVKVTSAHDVGRAINPQIVENQINMSLTLANGWVRSEEFVIDKRNGVLLNPNLLDYKIMTIMDMPKMSDIKEIYVEYPCAWGPFGAKGFSESGTTSVPGSIANAIYNAIGVRVRGDSLTPEAILEATGKLNRPRR